MTILHPLKRFLAAILCFLSLIADSSALDVKDYNSLFSRRKTLTTGAGAVLIVAAQADSCHAASPVNLGEAVRRGSANIPGYGQSDVFYPQVFLGTWKAQREVFKSGSANSLQLEYPIRFLKSIEDNAVVADRGWNQANLETAIKQFSLKDTATSLPSYQWVETNPNDLRLTFANGSRKEIKVTKRATEKTNDSVFSSEFQRITQDDNRGIPTVTARRVLNKWKVVDSSTIEGIEIVYDVGRGDPLSGPSTASDQNKLLSKSRLRLERVAGQ